MSIVMVGSTSGSITLQEPAVAGSTVLSLPAVSGTILTTTSPKAGNVIQVVSTNKVDTFTTTSTSLVDVTGLSVAITPASSSNRVFIIVQFYAGNTSAGDSCYFSLFRDSTQIGGGTPSSNRPTGFAMAICSDASGAYFVGNQFLDSPATTSAITYKIQMRVSGGTGSVGRTGNDSDTANRPRFASTITVMEIAA